MDQLIASLPKSVLAILILVAGLIAFRFLQPPYTVCDSQMELFREAQKKFLYGEKKEGAAINRAPLVDEMMDNCKGDNSPGGCFELFVSLQKFAVDLDAVPAMCSDAIGGEAAVKKTLWNSLKLMIQIAWGSKPPVSYVQKNGWFDTSEVTLYCSLQRQATRFFGTENFDHWRWDVVAGLPKADQLDRNGQWQRSLISTSCDLYK